MLRAARNILRLISIARILARHDALFVLDLLGLGPLPARLARLFLRGPRRGSRLRQGQRLADALRELGPAFIKFGQTWSTRADLIGEEDRWHLVDYVYSWSRDEPEYSTLVVASGVDTEIDVAVGPSLFGDTKPAFFPVFGQIMEPARAFYPTANAIEVRAERVQGLELRLESLSPSDTLRRGYAIVRRRPDGDVVSAAPQVAAGDSLDITLSQGEVEAEVTGVSRDDPPIEKVIVQS